MNSQQIIGTVKRVYFKGADGEKKAFLALNIEVPKGDFIRYFDVITFGKSAETHKGISENDLVYAEGETSLNLRQKEFPKIQVTASVIKRLNTVEEIVDAFGVGDFDVSDFG